ncbi:MAG: alpha/beta hydrolase [Actinomycetales bacterium]|nr:alpha/beta hydrolase [Candidatus Phosphoribacter baldrii]
MSLRIHRVPVSYGANIMAQEILPDGPVAGGTPTVVLAHGWCLDHTSWHKVLADLQTRRDVRVVLYDQRGHGKSSMGEVGDPTVRILGDDLREVIDMVAPDGPLVLAGHSMGGMSIMAYAGMHYEHFTGRVKGTVLASTAASIEGRTPVPLERVIMALASRAPGIQPRVFIPRMVEGRLIFGQGANRDDVRHAVDQIKHTKMPTIGRFFYAIAGHDEMDALGHFVDVPTHIVAGSHDRLIPVPHAEALRQRIPGADLNVLNGVGHMTTYEASSIICDAIVGLVDANTPPAPPARPAPGRGRR